MFVRKWQWKVTHMGPTGKVHWLIGPRWTACGIMISDPGDWKPASSCDSFLPGDEVMCKRCKIKTIPPARDEYGMG